MTICSIRKEETDETHPYDKKSCVDCVDEYFDSLRPPLTRWMEGLSAHEKSEIIRSLVKENIEKEREYRKHEQEAKASCCASYEELRMFKRLF